MVKLYSEHFERNYYARKFSWTNLFHVAIVTSVILMPFILAFATNNFWKPPTVYYGRPNVQFTNEVFVQAEIGGEVKSYSNVQLLNQNIRNRIDGPLFKSFTADKDNNRVVNDFEFDLAFKTGGSQVTNIAILMHFTYYVEDTVSTKFKGIVPIFISSPSGTSISRATLSGQLQLQQKIPLEVGGGIADTQYNFNFTEEMAKFSLEDMYNRFTDRNSSLSYDHTTLVMPYGESDSTHIHIEMNIPEYADVLYYPGFLESIKLAWVQYYAILVPVYVLLFLGLFGTSIESEIFPTVMINDIIPSIKTID